MVSRTRDTLVNEYQDYQHGVLAHALIALFACFGLVLALLPVAPAFRHFFRGQIGGDLGELLLGLSFPLIASPPVIAFLVWAHRRSNRPALCCTSCQCSFVAHWRFVRVRDTGRCPKCGAEQISVKE